MPVGLLEPASPNANDAAQYPNGVGALRPYKVTEGGSTYQVLLPVGKGESTEQAVERYKQTGNHFGKFDSAEHATAHAKQLTAPDKKGRTVNPEDVFLIWDSNTATDWKQGRPPRYTLAIRDADGTFMTLPSGGWAPDPKRAQGGTKTKEQFDLERAKAKSMTKAAKEAAQAAPVY